MEYASNAASSTGSGVLILQLHKMLL